MFLLQVIHLWFEEFALEETDLCTGDAVKLRDSLGSIGKSCIDSDPRGKRKQVFKMVSVLNKCIRFIDR